MPILDGLEITAKTAGNAIIEDAIMAVRKAVEEGKTISEPLAETKVFPPMVVQMINVGEQTGALDQMLSKIADFYEEEVDTAVAGLMKLIEPLMITVLGGDHRHHRHRHVPAALLDPTRSGRRCEYRGRPSPPAHAPARQLRWYIAIRVVAIGSVLLPYDLAAARLIAIRLGGDHQRRRCRRTVLLAAAGARAPSSPLPQRVRLRCSPALTFARHACSTSPCSGSCAAAPALQAYVQFVGDLLLDHRPGLLLRRRRQPVLDCST